MTSSSRRAGVAAPRGLASVRPSSLRPWSHGSLLASRAALLAALLALLGGCGRDRDREDRVEADRVLRAVDALVAADRDAKSMPLAALAALPCRADDVCKLRQACVDAFGPMVRAMNLKAQVRDELRGDGAPDPDALGRKLEQAEQDLAEAKRLVEGCSTASGAVRQAYRL